MIKGWTKGGVLGTLILQLSACVVANGEHICESFCTKMDNDCIGPETAEFADKTECLAVCDTWEVGSVSSALSGSANGGNTLACREQRRGLLIGTLEPTDCQTLGPAGYSLSDLAQPGAQGTERENVESSGELFCGGPCTAYCDLRAALCGQQDISACRKQCRYLKLVPGNRGVARAQEQDTVECRMTLLMRAAVPGSNRSLLCDQSQVHVYVAEASDSPCRSKSNCEDHCQMFAAVCGSQVDEECLDYCKDYTRTDEFPLGLPEDTLECRVFHTYNAITDGPTGAQIHCPHASSNGQGRCD